MNEDKQRIIQEYVPGKQITLLHIIAQPVDDLYERLGVENQGSIGIVTVTPGEGAIISADIATKAGDVSIGFLDRFSGSLVITGDIASVEASFEAISRVLESELKFTSCPITRT